MVSTVICLCLYGLCGYSLQLDLPRRGAGRGCCLLSPECLACVLQVLLPAAGLLQLQDVKKTCCEFLESQLHPVNCLGIRAFADMHACTDLLNKANTYAGKCNKPLQAGFETGGKQTPEISVTPQCTVESRVRLLGLGVIKLCLKL